MADAPRPDRTASEDDAAETTARILLETEAVLFQPDNPFTFTSASRQKGLAATRRSKAS